MTPSPPATPSATMAHRKTVRTGLRRRRGGGCRRRQLRRQRRLLRPRRPRARRLQRSLVPITDPGGVMPVIYVAALVVATPIRRLQPLRRNHRAADPERPRHRRRPYRRRRGRHGPDRWPPKNTRSTWSKTAPRRMAPATMAAAPAPSAHRRLLHQFGKHHCTGGRGGWPTPR